MPEGHEVLWDKSWGDMGPEGTGWEAAPETPPHILSLQRMKMRI